MSDRPMMPIDADTPYESGGAPECPECGDPQPHTHTRQPSTRTAESRTADRWPRTKAGRQIARDWRQHGESCRARRGEWSPVTMSDCSCGQVDNILAIEAEAAAPAGPLAGYWTVTGNQALTKEQVDGFAPLLKEAAAIGQQVVVYEGITLHWTPMAAAPAGLDVLRDIYDSARRMDGVCRWCDAPPPDADHDHDVACPAAKAGYALNLPGYRDWQRAARLLHGKRDDG